MLPNGFLNLTILYKSFIFNILIQPVVHGPYWQLDPLDMRLVRGVKHKKHVISLVHRGTRRANAGKIRIYFMSSHIDLGRFK